jgi:hypothetical protein
VHLGRPFQERRAILSLAQGQLGELFDLDYDLLLYDVTSAYFEGER